MIKTNYVVFCRNLAQTNSISDSDFSYILRIILSRGAEEANYLAFRSQGKAAAEFKHIRIALQGLVSDLPEMLDRDGSVPRHHRATLRKAVTLSRYLIAIERELTAAQLDMLDQRLKNPGGIGRRFRKAA